MSDLKHRKIFEELARKTDDIYAESIKLDHDDSDTYVCPVLDKLDKLRNDLARLAGKADVTEFYSKWQAERSISSGENVKA